VKSPLVPWIFTVAGPFLWLALALHHARITARRRFLSPGALLFIAGTTMWWQEWYADWGSYLLFNGHFPLIPWGSSTWTSPNKPWAVIPAYGWFFGLALPGLLALVAALRRRVPEWSTWGLVAAVVVPVFYLIDLGLESTASRLGWWSYTRTVGPTLSTPRGSFPLFYPAGVFVVWAVVTVRLLVERDDTGHWRHERLLRIPRIPPGWKREIARASVWALTLNALFWFVLVLPTILLRHAFGHPSALVP
jgi:hypothetical protein